VATNLQATKTDDVSACSGNALGREMRSGDIVCRDETFVTAFLRLQENIPQRCFLCIQKVAEDAMSVARPGLEPDPRRAGHASCYVT
jgi:hypothetical protein